jgi:hypothetical protein
MWRGFRGIYDDFVSPYRCVYTVAHRERGFDYYSPSLVGKGLGVRFLRL